MHMVASNDIYQSAGLSIVSSIYIDNQVHVLSVKVLQLDIR